MKTNPSLMLNQQIQLLEEKRERDLIALKEQMQVTGESLKPSNLMKGAMQHVATGQQARYALKKAVIGLLLGMATEKIVSLKPGKNSNSFLGMAVNVGFNLLFANRYMLVKSVGALVVSAIVIKVRKNKEKKRLAKQDPRLVPAPVVA